MADGTPGTTPPQAPAAPASPAAPAAPDRATNAHEPARALGGPRPTAPATPSTDDWPIQATDAIVRTVDRVREQTTGRAIVIATGAVYGLVIATAASIIGIIAVILWFRVNERAFAWVAESLLGIEDPQPMWVVYLLYGGILTVAGLVCWRKRKGALAAK